MNNVYFFDDILIATGAWDHHTMNVQYTGVTGDSNDHHMTMNVQYTGVTGDSNHHHMTMNVQYTGVTGDSN